MHLLGSAAPIESLFPLCSQISVWFPAQFAELRRMCLSHCGGEAAFCASLSRCHRCCIHMATTLHS